MPTKKVTTATLIRGQLYSYIDPYSNPRMPIRFERNKPVQIDDPRVVKDLENIYDTTQDGDGEEFEKPIFRIDRQVDSSVVEAAHRKPMKRRLSASRPVAGKRRIDAN